MRDPHALAPRWPGGRNRRDSDPETTGRPLTEYRRYYLHGAFILMAAAAVILAATGALGGGSHPLALTAPTPQAALSESPSAGYPRPPVVLATSSGIYIVNPEPAPAPKPTAEAAPAATPTPEPTPEPQPAFIVYTVQPGDTIDGIAAALGVDL